MNQSSHMTCGRNPQRGNSLVLVASCLVALILMAGLAIDLVNYYVVRSEAQRAADAAALAGAESFVSSGCTSASGGCVSGGSQEAPASQQAISVGSQNVVGGQTPTINSADVSFNYPTAYNPTITVTVARNTSHGGEVPTLFMKILGHASYPISASATAEAYNPGGGCGPPVGQQCLKPWIVPNVDPDHWAQATPPFNPPCPLPPATPAPMTTVNWCFPQGQQNTYFSTIVNPSTGMITNPGVNTGLNSGGVIGEAMTLKPGDPSCAAAPSQFYPITIPPGTTPTLCPNCSGPGAGSGGASLYAQNIECCNSSTFACGSGITLDTKTGNMQGPTESGVECLINEDKGTQTGQDTICGLSVLPADTPAPCSLPFSIFGGLNNPNPNVRDQQVTSSSSVVTAPIYNGAPLTPGQSTGASRITAIGFVQFFLVSVDTSGGPASTCNIKNGPQKGDVHAIVLNVATCGSSGGSGGGGGGSGCGSGGTISSGGSSPIPVRLIHN